MKLEIDPKLLEEENTGVETGNSPVLDDAESSLHNEETAKPDDSSGSSSPANLADQTETDDSSVLETPETGVLDESSRENIAVDDTADTFPKAYVDKLRKEAADNRVKAKRADDLAQQVHTLLVEKTGRLADATDLPFDAAHLDDPAALDAAISDLLAAKPHLASRTPRGNIGQGVNVPKTDEFSLAGWLKGA